MVRRYIVTLASLGVAVLVTTPVLSCTTVCVIEKDKAVVAYNYDFYPSEGLVLVNKRGMRKASFIPALGGDLGRHLRQCDVQSIRPRQSDDRHQREGSHGLPDVAR